MALKEVTKVRFMHGSYRKEFRRIRFKFDHDKGHWIGIDVELWKYWIEWGICFRFPKLVK